MFYSADSLHWDPGFQGKQLSLAVDVAKMLAVAMLLMQCVTCYITGNRLGWGKVENCQLSPFGPQAARWIDMVWVICGAWNNWLDCHSLSLFFFFFFFFYDKQFFFKFFFAPPSFSSFDFFFFFFFFFNDQPFSFKFDLAPPSFHSFDLFVSVYNYFMCLRSPLGDKLSFWVELN